MHSDAIVGLISIVACGCVLPIVMGWMSTRRKMNETETRRQIILAAIEKNKETDVEELLKKMAPKQKLLKEKLLAKLLWGCIISFIGMSVLASALWMDLCIDRANPGVLFFFYSCGGVLFAIGLGFLIYYFVGKKMLAKEIEAEEKKLTTEANQ